MSKKKPQQPETEEMQTTAGDSRAGSRHKPRKTISMTPRRYELLKQLAARNKRPINWEARIAIDKALVEAGLLTQEEADSMMDEFGMDDPADD